MRKNSVTGPVSRSEFSETFYALHAKRYAEVSHQFLQSVYISSSHPRLKGDLDLLCRLRELVPGKRGLDAGCGAGARDVSYLWSEGYDIYGLDAIFENIRVAKEWHPEINGRLLIHDLREPLPFSDACFDFLICNAVIRHIEPRDVFGTVWTEFARVLRPGGVLQIMFKNGSGTAAVFDPDYGVERCFQLYEEQRVLQSLKKNGFSLVEAEGEKLGGMMNFSDPKPINHCVFFMRKNV